MLTGHPPFQSKTQEEIYKKVRNLSYVWPKDFECGNYIPLEAKSLVSSCLNLDEDKRPEPDDIVEHAFFKMYSGCIPGQLDTACRETKPIWLKMEDPRGDRMFSGYSLEHDGKYLSKAARISDPGKRYQVCEEEFYAECGVGRKSDGSIRRAAGSNCSKSTYAECMAEDNQGLQPVVPLPKGSVYKYPHNPNGDWSVYRETLRRGQGPEPSVEDDDISDRCNTPPLNNAATLAKTQVALAAAQARRLEMQPQSYAATLRQQALPTRTSPRRVVTTQNPQTTTEPMKRPPPKDPAPVSSQRGLAERPVRLPVGVTASYTASVRELDRIVAAPTSIPNNLSMGKTRSESRRQLESMAQERKPAILISEKDTQPGRGQKVPGTGRLQPTRQRSQEQTGDSRKDKDNAKTTADSQSIERGDGGQKKSTRSMSKSASSGNKTRSTLGLSPLIHSRDKTELVQRSSPDEVIADIRRLLSNLTAPSIRKHRAQARCRPHAYVIKWVDYTNRYGIGYVLDDGSVGCVFKAENGQPASCVIVRDGEAHIRRKAQSIENTDGAILPYPEANQLVPRDGKPVEFYENADNGSVESRGIRKVLVHPSVFEVKFSNSSSTSSGIRVSTDSVAECPRCDVEKLKRVKLVDQFGKYMIGSLGRHGDESTSGNEAYQVSSGQYIKFYQRLGNVGVWGFGDGAFQASFVIQF
jgi:serine/threonine protein kinase